MKKIRLSEYKDTSLKDGYELNSTEKYVLIEMESELKMQNAILSAFQIMGTPPALVNYHAWLHENGFNVECPNPTNDFVSSFYGVKPLWKTDFSQGIVVKIDGDDDFYIVMECSKKNKGYKNTKVILTLGGCL